MSNKKMSIPDEHLRALRAEMCPYIENSLYEHSHFLNVERHIKVLAKQRQLDTNLALAIAYLHDISRLQEGVMGKQHAKRSAEIVRSKLEPYLKKDLSKATINTVCSAILHHNQKSKIHEPYDELIKDADSLAHQDEFGYPTDKEYERIRIELIGQKETQFSIVSEVEIATLFSRYCDHLIALLETPPKDFNHWVHEVRVTIRKIGALLYFSENGGLKRDTNLALKPIFKKLSKSRMLYVVSRNLSTQEAFPLLKEDLGTALEAENTLLKAYLKDHLNSDFITILKNQLNGNEYYLNFDSNLFLKLVKSYIKRLNFTEMNDVHALHQLRIEGKHLKYILGSGMVQLSDSTLQDTILTLHDLLGDLNDISDQRKFFKTLSIDPEEYQLLLTHQESQFKFLRSEVKKRVFLLKKMIALNKIIL